MAKENKFTKSVLERLTEDRKKEETTPMITPAEPIKKAPAKIAENAKMSIQPPAIETPAPTSKQRLQKGGRGEVAIPDLSAFLSNEAPRYAKNKTFYLDVEVINTIKKAAKDGGTTDSKLVNDIMRKVLGLD